MCRLPARLPQDNVITRVHRQTALKIRQAKSDPAIATIGGAQNGEKRLVLVDGEQLAVALLPALRCKTERENANFAKKGGGHKFV